MRWCYLLVLLLLAFPAKSQEPTSYESILQQRNAQLEETVSQQHDLLPFEQMQQFEHTNQLASFLAPQPQALFSTARLPASELESMGGAIGGDSSTPTFVSEGVVESSINGLPYVPMDQAVMQFVQHQQQIAQQDQEQQQMTRDLEAGATPASAANTPNSPQPSAPWFGIHKAVPKLQQWLTAMDPMSYSGPTFTNPVAKQVLKRLADPALPFGERAKLQRLVSSPYMFNMLGNPAFEDPQLWSGLVSGAAVPFPLRNTIMAQRTEIPFRVGATGDAMTNLDQVSVSEYSKALENSPNPNNPNQPATHAARHRIFKIIQHLNQAQTAETFQKQPTPHENPLKHTFKTQKRGASYEEERSKKSMSSATKREKADGQNAGQNDAEETADLFGDTL